MLFLIYKKFPENLFDGVEIVEKITISMEKVFFKR